MKNTSSVGTDIHIGISNQPVSFGSFLQRYLSYKSLECCRKFNLAQKLVGSFGSLDTDEDAIRQCGKTRCNKVGYGQGHVKRTTFNRNLHKYPAVFVANNARTAFPL